jgi:hypothetical protein
MTSTIGIRGFAHGCHPLGRRKRRRDVKNPLSIGRSRMRGETRRRDWSTEAQTGRDRRTRREQTIAAAITLDLASSEGAATDKDRIKEEAAGKIFSDKQLKTTGNADNAMGKLQNAVDGLKHSLLGE